ncbi:MAG: B12-binding domain-containing radical SAM protein [Spirochaetales bacterium]|nr:B12-binding domain-containing radical SAM protein [Spirochaetales bacterium]
MQRTILLLQPWVEDFYSTDCRIQPIGLAYLAASIKRAFPDYAVVIYDALAGGKKRTIPWPEEFDYLKPYYHSRQEKDFALFSAYRRTGKSEEQIRQDLSAYQPLLIGISALFTPYYRQSLALASICRSLFGEVPIVMGGSHATLHPETLLGPLVDYVLAGEAEMSIVALIQALCRERSLTAVPGLVYRSGSGIQKNAQESPDIHQIALPDLSSLSQKDYRFRGVPMTFLITSRSCPHRCSFCSIHAVFGQRYSMRRVADILEEIRIRYEEGFRHFDIEDDNFTVNKKEVKALLRAIIEQHWPITFSAMNGLSYISLDEELLLLMRQAGFSHLNLALVSADEIVRRMTERPHTLERFYEVMEVARSLGFQITVYFIIGLPGQTLESMCSTLKVLAGSPCLLGVSPFYYTPGSPIHRQGHADLRLASAGRDPYFAARLTALDVESDLWDRRDLYTLFKWTRVVNAAKEGLDKGPQGAELLNRALEILRGERLLEEPAIYSQKVVQEMQRKGWAIQGYLTATTCDVPITERKAG